jgi:hypothetical protein
MAHRRFSLWGLALVAVLVTGLFGGLATSAAAVDGKRTIRGTIEGVKFRVEMPERWNGTLVLFSHGYYPDFFAPDDIEMANRPETATWLVDHGYAIAASEFNGKFGFTVEPALHDQIALLDWFDANIGHPRRTISSGMSMGGGIATLLSEHNPRRFDGVLAMCSDINMSATWNQGLDVLFAVRTLLAPDAGIELVKSPDPDVDTQTLTRVVTEAQATAQGRARLALAGALGGIPGWADAHNPAPTKLLDRLNAQSAWIAGAAVFGLGPTARADLEGRAGGNPSWNVGVDYRKMLANSHERQLAESAYREAGLSLKSDVDKLQAAERIRPDTSALLYMQRFTGVRGRTPAPVFTMHNTFDGGSMVEQEAWYGKQVRRNGDPDRLRQTYVDRGGHCGFSAAEEIVALKTLEAKIGTGRWPSTDPRRLNAAAREFPGPDLHKVLDFFRFTSVPMSPAFVQFTPHDPLR